MRVTRYHAAGLIAVLIILGVSVPARSDDPVTSAVRFNREIIRIFDRKCLSCHAPGGISMSLATYRDARPWFRAIREEIVEQRMPPWSAARGYARFEGDIGLTPRELTTILTWVDGGVPKGDESDLPASSVSAGPDAVEKPDHRVDIPPQQIPGDAEDVVRRVTLDCSLTTDRWVRHLRVRPGDRRLLRAAFVSVVSNGQRTAWAGAWTPWQPSVIAPAPGAFLVRAGSRLEVELHYRGQDAATTDRSAIEFFFAPDGKWREMISLAIETDQAVKHANSARRKGEVTLTRDTVVGALRPEMAADDQSLEVTAHKADGSVEVLLWIPKYRAEWPAPFVFKEPVRLPAGTVISVTATGTPPPLRARVILLGYQ